MLNWYGFAVFALVLLGVQRFLYKVSAERKCNTVLTTRSFMATVAILSSILVFVLNESVSNIPYLLLIAGLNGGAFFIATVSHMEALKHIPAGVAYPIIRLNAVIVVLFSIFYFKDRLSPYQYLGIASAMAVIVILTRQLSDKQDSYGDIRRGIIFVFISLLGGAGAAITSKFAAIYTSKMAFMALSYIISTLFSLALRKTFEKEEVMGSRRDALIIGFFMGLINLAGFYLFLEALSLGPLSIIASTTGMHFVIAIVLSAVIYKERLTPSRILGVVLTIISIILLRL